MTARKLAFLRQLLWAATLAIGFGTLWSCAGALVEHLDSRGVAGREQASARTARCQVRRHATDPEHSAEQLVPVDLPRPEWQRARSSGPIRLNFWGEEKRPGASLIPVR